MNRGLAQAVNEGSVEAVEAWFEVEKKKPAVADILWCALWTEDDDIRLFLAEIASKKKIKPVKKGWPWNDAHAAAISGNPEKIAVAEKRGADFAALCPAGTPLTIAARLGHLDFVRALLERGDDLKTSIKMAPFQKISIFGGSLLMIDTTPLGVALRTGNQAMVDLFLEFQTPEPSHLEDAVEGADVALVQQMLDLLGDKAPLEPKLFWSVRNPVVLPVLEKGGFDLSKIPDDTGTWGGPIWSWWAYYLRGDSDDPVERFAGLFEAGVRPTADAMAAVLDANVRGIATVEMVDLFLKHGVDLADEVSWEGDDWDEKNNCNVQVNGSVAERMMERGSLALVQHLHSKGAAIRPLRAQPNWDDFEEKSAWLAEQKLLREIEPQEFPWVESPSVDEVRKFLATDNGIFGLRLGMTKDELDGWDLERADGGEDFRIEFGDGIDFVSREYRDIDYQVADAMEEALTAKFGKSKGRGRKKKWTFEGGEVTLKDESNDYYFGLRIEMIIE